MAPPPKGGAIRTRLTRTVAAVALAAARADSAAVIADSANAAVTPSGSVPNAGAESVPAGRRQ